MRHAVLFVLIAVCALGCVLPNMEQRNPDPSYEGKSLGYWVQRLKKADKSEDRQAAAEVIKSFGAQAKAAVPDLIPLLNDCSESYRRLVAEILAAIGPDAREAVPTLKRVLRDDNPKVRLAAAIALWKIEKNTAVVPVLARLLGEADADGDREWIAYQAAETLGEMGPAAREALPELRKVPLGKDGNLFAQVAAKDAIAKIDPAEAKKIEEIWDKDPSQRITFPIAPPAPGLDSRWNERKP